MRLLIIGGHMSPALALIEALPKNIEILYVGRKYALEGEKTFSLEYQTVSARKIPFAPITTGRLQRAWTRHTLPSLFKLPVGFLCAFRIIKKFKPTVIIGFGGYVQVPLCIAGYLLRIPIVIHEQTLERGLANKIIAPYATKICLSWKTSSTFFPRNKTVLTGNPAVSSVPSASTGTASPFDKLRVRNDKLPRIVIVGGSLGSHAINEIVFACLEDLAREYSVFHQTGDAQEFHDFERLEKRKQELESKIKQRYTILKFVDPSEIIHVFQNADIVISRAGMNTITTLLLLQKPSLLIPLPVSQHNEQLKNALFLKDHGLAEILPQNEMTSEKFLSAIHAMIKNKAEYFNKKDSAEIMIHKESAKKIIEILKYVEKSPA